MGSASNLLVRREPGGLVIATINRPDKWNALNKEVFDEMKHLVDVLETDKTARALILTGAGDKAFCGGADLKERQGMNEKDVLLRFDFIRHLFLRFERLVIPTIAAINGSALGGGVEIALACDLRIAADTAVLGFPEVDLAIIPGNGGTQRLPRLIGMAKALELILLAKRLTAQEALGYGLVTQVVPAKELMSKTLAVAGKMIEGAPIALKAAKQAIRTGMERTLEQGLLVETEAYKACLYSKDRLEGLKAFNEKRKPAYRGE